MRIQIHRIVHSYMIKNVHSYIDIYKLANCPDYMMKFYHSLSEKSYTTQKAYVYYVIDFVSFLEREYLIDIRHITSYKDVSSGMIDYYMSTLGDLSESNRRCRFYGIRSFFLFLKKNKHIEANPCDDVEVPKDRKERKVTALDKREIKIVKKCISNGSGSDLAKERQREWINRDRALIMLALSLGLRVTSIIEINVEDIDFNQRTLTVTEKNNKTRILPFGQQLCEVIEKWIADRDEMLNKKHKECDALFISNRMNRISKTAVRALVEKYTIGVDKHISPHKLRATCATMLYSETKDLELTRIMLGHNNPRTTERYIGINEEERERAVNSLENVFF